MNRCWLPMIIILILIAIEKCLVIKNPMENEHKNIYGILVLIYSKFTGILCYNGVYHEENNEMDDNFLYIHLNCNDEIMNCLAMSKYLCNINGVSNGNILLRIIYSNMFLYLGNEVVMTPKYSLSHNITSEYLLYQGIERNNELDSHTTALYTFVNRNFDLISGKVVNNAYIEITPYNFVIGFITNNPNIYEDMFVSKIKFRKSSYYVYANEFYCISPVELLKISTNILISMNKKSKNQQYNSTIIHHPCIEMGKIINSDMVERYAICQRNIDHKEIYTAIGIFDEEKCLEILQKILYDNKLCPSGEGCNFSDITSKIILPSSSRKIIMSTDFFEPVQMPYREFFNGLSDFLNLCKNSSIFPSEQNGKTLEESDSMNSYSCISALLLREYFNRYILRDDSLSVEIIDIESDNTYYERRFIFTDPRIGCRLSSHLLELKPTYKTLVIIRIKMILIKDYIHSNPIFIVFTSVFVGGLLLVIICCLMIYIW